MNLYAPFWGVCMLAVLAGVYYCYLCDRGLLCCIGVLICYRPAIAPSPIYPYIHESISMSPPYAAYAGYILCTFLLSTRFRRGFYMVARRLRAGFLSVPQGILSAILPAIITASPQVIRLAGYRLLRLRMQAGS